MVQRLVDSGDTMKISPNSYINTNARPSWSSDGSKVAYQLGQSAYVVDLGQDSVVELGREQAWNAAPQIDPDSDTVVFASYDYIEDSEYPRWGVYSKDLESGETRLLSDQGRKPVYSPNGDEIAFLGYYGKRLDNRITMMNEDGLEEAPVVPKGTLQTEFSFDSDGDRLAYQTYTGPFPELRVLDRNWGKDMPLTNSREGEFWDRSPQWSPDDKTVLFERHERIVDPKVSLWTVDVATGEEKEIPLPPGRHMDPTWSPDGSKIAFMSNLDGGGWYDLYTVDADGGNLIRVKDALGDQHAPSWSPDGKTLAYLSFDWNKPPEYQHTFHTVEMK